MRWFRLSVAGALALGGILLTAGMAAASTPLTANLSGPTHAVAGEPVALDASASTGDGLRFAWDFGDGTFDLGGPQMSHVYAQAGTYTVNIDVTDAEHGDAFASLTVVVVEQQSDLEVSGGVLPIVITPPEQPFILPSPGDVLP